MISRLKRSAEIVAVTCGGRSLMTTRRSSLSSRATKTRDMPPPPSSRSRTYLSAKWDWRSASRSDTVYSIRKERAAFNAVTGRRSLRRRLDRRFVPASEADGRHGQHRGRQESVTDARMLAMPGQMAILLVPNELWVGLGIAVLDLGRRAGLGELAVHLGGDLVGGHLRHGRLGPCS